jgi:hypothetical protein
MEFGVHNPLMLTGLVAVGLPVLVHLFRWRSPVVIRWGAMQFLRSSQQLQRRSSLRNLWLLVLRCLLIACFVLMLAGPWGRGTLWGISGVSPRQDLVVILDCSGSMSRKLNSETNAETLHQTALRWTTERMDLLRPGETLTVIEARQVPRQWNSSFGEEEEVRLRQRLQHIAPPDGSSNLSAALAQALIHLQTTRNPRRQIVVLSDRQAQAWQPASLSAWAPVRDLLAQFQSPPEIHVVDLEPPGHKGENVSVSSVRLSHARIVPGIPVRIRATLTRFGGEGRTTRTVSLSLHGQSVPGAMQQVPLTPDSQTEVEFQQVFPLPGEYLVTVTATADQDAMPADDAAQAVLVVEPQWQVGIVEGDRRLDSTRSEAFFLQSALAASGRESPRIQTTLLDLETLNDLSLARSQVLFLCNVPQVSVQQWRLIEEFVEQGGGLVFAPGDRVASARWNELNARSGRPVLPMTLEAISGIDQAASPATLDKASLNAEWLQRFRAERHTDFTTLLLNRWWRLGGSLASEPDQASDAQVASAQVLLRGSNGEVLAVVNRFGQGCVIQLAFPLDADWSNLPALQDFVPFLHEMIFHLGENSCRRNVEVGSPLELACLPGSEDEFPDGSGFVVQGPGVDPVPAQRRPRGRRTIALFSQTQVPGVYRFVCDTGPKQGREHLFVVAGDSAESDLTPVRSEDWHLLERDCRIHRLAHLSDVNRVPASQMPHTDLRGMVLLCLLLLLTCETWLSHQRAQGTGPARQN